MQVILDALQASDLPAGTVATIGNYDGIHRGQRSVIDLVVARAKELDLPSAVVTFDPHPLKVLRPQAAPAQLTTFDQKTALLAEAGVDFTMKVHFTPELAKTGARDFVQRFLHEGMGAREIYVGSDFSFGRDREGNLALLKELGKELGFEAIAVDEVRSGAERVSSTRVREVVADGQVEQAIDLLGRPYTLVGIIARGDRMGQRLGWPTINLQPDNELIPLDGVYASRVFFPSFPARFDSVTNIGTRPTVYENYERVVESHVLDFRSDVYGERVELSFYRRLREEKLFQSTMDLSAQISRDVETSREFFRSLTEQEAAAAATD